MISLDLRAICFPFTALVKFLVISKKHSYKFYIFVISEREST